MSRDSTGKKCRVHFAPNNVDVTVEPGSNLLEAARRADVPIVAACGGAGTCGTCKVVVEKGRVDYTRTARVSDEELAGNIRQACQSKVLSDLQVYVPLESRLESAVTAGRRKGKPGAALASQGTLATGWRFSPPFSKHFLQLPAPTMTDNVSDLSRLLRGLKQEHKLGNMTVDFDVVKGLPAALRAEDWRVTVSTLVTAIDPQTTARRRPRLIRVEAGDTRQRHYSLAVDVGTTTVKGQLLDLGHGRVIAEAADFNGQRAFGADVITRIAYCQKPGGLDTLQGVVVGTINQIIAQLLHDTGVDRSDIGHLSVAGNTTMIQIMLGIDPKYIRLSPYTPAATYLPPVKASSLGLALSDHVYLSAFPQVASYIGGDIISGVVAAGLHQTGKLTLYMDIGTNGQIVVGNSDWMVTAACSAGPAFEGGDIKFGMVAASGAIEGFHISPADCEPTIGTIDGAKPKGICGSGLINIVAGLLESRIIGQNGRFQANCPGDRVRQGGDGPEYVVARAAETQIGKDIVITEIDIDNLMRAKAAMYAGFKTLIESVGQTPRDVEQIIIAGAFGSYIDVEQAIAIGLLPDVPRDRFIFIGNGSLMGARLADYSVDIIDEVRRVARLMTNFELSENAGFMNNYVAALFLPHTNVEEFPSVSRRLAAAIPSPQGSGGV